MSDFIVKWRWLVLAATLALAGLAGFGMTRLQLSADYRVFFGSDNPRLATFEGLERRFAKADTVVFTLHADKGSIFSPAGLAATHWLTKQAWKLPYAMRADSLTNFQHIAAAEDDLTVGDLVPDPGKLTPARIAEIRRIALAEPSLARRVISPDGESTAIVANLQQPAGKADAPLVVTAAARRIAAEFVQKFPGFTVGLTGSTLLNNTLVEAAQHDLVTLFPVMFVLLAVLLWLFLRSFVAALGSMLVVVLSTVSALGIGGWLGMPLTAATSAAPAIILTISIEYAVLILTGIFNLMQQGQDRRAAIAATIRVNMVAIFVTGLTTIIGFADMNFTDSPPFRDLGNLALGGAVLSCLYSLFFLPAFLAIVPLKKARPIDWELHLFAPVIELVIRRKYWVIGVAVFMMAGVGALMPRMVINDNVVDFFAPSIQFRKDTDFAAARLAGNDVVLFGLDSGRANGVTDPAYLQHLDAFATWLRGLPEVQNVMAFSDIMKRLNQKMNGDDPAAYRLPADGEKAAQYLLLYEMSLPFGLDLNNQLDVDKKASQLVATLRPSSTAEVQAFKAKSEAWLRAHAPTPMQVEASGMSVMFSFITNDNVRSMIQGTFWSFLLISGCLYFMLRDWRLAVFSLIPNIMPTLLAFGVWALFKNELGLYAAFVTTMALGVISDFVIHLLDKYKHAMAQPGATPEDALRETFGKVGGAVLMSALILCGGFAVISISDFRINAYCAMMNALTILFSLLTNFVFMPAFLLVLDRRRSRAARSAAPALSGRERIEPAEPAWTAAPANAGPVMAMQTHLAQALEDRLADPLPADAALAPPPARDQSLRLADISRKYAAGLPAAQDDAPAEPVMPPAAMRGKFGRRGL